MLEVPEVSEEEVAELVAARLERVSLVFAALEGLAAEEDEDDVGCEVGIDDWDELNPASVRSIASSRIGAALRGNATSRSAAGSVDVSDAPTRTGASGAAPSAEAIKYFGTWQPRGYLLKLSPAASQAAIFKRLGWQRRWFEVRGQELSWYGSAKAAEAGGEPLGRVPLAMILTATPAAASGSFEVELGNRTMQLCLDGVPKVLHNEAVRRWIAALVKHEVLAEAGDGANSHQGKFWKVNGGK